MTSSPDVTGQLGNTTHNELAKSVLEGLASALVNTDCGNIATNRKLWDSYAREWNAKAQWVEKMASNLGSDEIARPEGEPKTRQLKFVGDEWATDRDVHEVVDEFIKPYVDGETTAAEIGSGGGRLAHYVLPHVKHLSCFDISTEMINKAKASLVEHKNLRFQLIQEPGDLHVYFEQFDFIYCFDVMVHMDVHTMYRYFQCLRGMLKAAGKAFVSTANILSPGGWTRFSAQTKYTVAGFYFVSPDIVRRLVEEAGLRVIKEGQPRDDNTYLNRDFLLVVEKPV